jgi:hypothetical protein
MENVEGIKTEETGAENQTAEKIDTVDVQAEAQKIADAIVAKKLAKMPSKEELQKYKEWEESKKTETEKQTEELQKKAQIENENNQLKNEIKLLKKSIKVEDIDYVLFKLSKLEGDFDENLEIFLKENSKYTKEEVKETNGVATNRSSEVKEGGVSAILRAKHPNLF